MESNNVPGLGWVTAFQMAPKKTLAINAKMHRYSTQKLCQHFIDNLQIKTGIIFLDGGVEESFYDTDGEPIFRQNSWFQYLFGVKEPGFSGAIDISTQKITLFMPRLPEEYQIWQGTIQPPSYFQQLYDVDEVLYTDEKESWLLNQLSIHNTPSDTSSSFHFYLLQGINTDSGLTAKPADLPDRLSTQSQGNLIDLTHLHHALSTTRVIKSAAEQTVMQYSAYIASNAHVQVMRATKSGMMEYELEALFRYEIYKNGGCRHTAYTSICACGPNSAVLHYGHAAAPNTGVLQEQDMALLDMGANYHGYCSDITCSVRDMSK